MRSDQVVQGFIQADLEICPQWRLHSISVPMLSCSQGEKVLVGELAEWQNSEGCHQRR